MVYAADLKSATRKGYVGSSPTPGIKRRSDQDPALSARGAHERIESRNGDRGHAASDASWHPGDGRRGDPELPRRAADRAALEGPRREQAVHVVRGASVLDL